MVCPTLTVAGVAAMLALSAAGGTMATAALVTAAAVTVAPELASVPLAPTVNVMLPAAVGV